MIIDAGRVSIMVESQEAEAAESTACEEQPHRIEPCRKHDRSRGNRKGGGLPPGVRRTRHHHAAGDDKSHGYRDQTETHDPLPWRGAEPIP